MTISLQRLLARRSVYSYSVPCNGPSDLEDIRIIRIYISGLSSFTVPRRFVPVDIRPAHGLHGPLTSTSMTPTRKIPPGDPVSFIPTQPFTDTGHGFLWRRRAGGNALYLLSAVARCLVIILSLSNGRLSETRLRVTWREYHRRPILQLRSSSDNSPTPSTTRLARFL
jgi:hypothetical protein